MAYAVRPCALTMRCEHGGFIQDEATDQAVRQLARSNARRSPRQFARRSSMNTTCPFRNSADGAAEANQDLFFSLSKPGGIVSRQGVLDELSSDV